MKKITTLLSSLFLLFFVFVSPAHAKVMVQEQGGIVVAKEEVVNDDLFIGAESVEILGTVNGDVYVGAGSVRVEGQINGDLVVGGGEVTIGGKIGDDVYVGAGNVNILSAQIGGSLLIGSGNAFIDDKSSVGGSLIAGAGNFDNRGDVGRNLMAGAGSFKLNSNVLGEVRVGAGEIKVENTSKVGKDFYYMTEDGGKVDVPEGVVSGSLSKLEPSQKYTDDLNMMRSDFREFGKVARSGFLFFSFFGSLLVGVLAIKIFGKASEKISDSVFTDFFSKLGVGFLILLMSIPAAIILMITGVGFALGSIILSLFFVAVYLSKLVFALALGKWISGQFNWKKLNVYLNFALGLLIFYLIKAVPGIGPFAAFLATSVGLGSLAKSFKK